ncbi:MAG: competence/damage-inducible protein A [Chloroflexi bacterium]|nr:MAG: competence/damage-inducible protein A [Chloroflexota bacterium]
MPSAEIITIGTEILLGEIVDTNSAWLARRLRDLNVDVFRTSTVGDNAQRIAAIIRETMERTQIIITTGGLGPTVDDPTREAVALAFGVETEFRPELWEQIIERMGRFGRTPTENQKRQAYIPKGAAAIENAVGTAPAFLVEFGAGLHPLPPLPLRAHVPKAGEGLGVRGVLISLPGVPREMEYLAENKVFPYLRSHFNLSGTIKARVLHCAGLGEGIIDDKIGDLELLANPTVGLAAHYGVVDIRITAKAESEDRADELIAGVEQTVRERLGAAIFGADEETLEGVVLAGLAQRGETLAVVEVNTGGELSRRLSRAGSAAFPGGKILSGLAEGQSLADAAMAEMKSLGASAAIGLTATPAAGRSEAEIVILTGRGRKVEKRGYGGHPKNVSNWGANIALDLLRAELG